MSYEKFKELRKTVTGDTTIAELETMDLSKESKTDILDAEYRLIKGLLESMNGRKN